MRLADRLCFITNYTELNVHLFDSYLFLSANLKSRVKKGQMSQDKFEKTLTLLKGALDYESFRDVDMVIEVL